MPTIQEDTEGQGSMTSSAVDSGISEWEESPEGSSVAAISKEEKKAVAADDAKKPVAADDAKKPVAADAVPGVEGRPKYPEADSLDRSQKSTSNT